MRRRLVLSVLATVACAAPLVVAGPGASAASRPTATLRPVHAKITAGHAPEFKYSVANVRTTKVILQRQFGTERVWKTVHGTTRRSGTIWAPKLSQLGLYVYRIRGLYHGHVKVTSANRTIKAYGRISLRAFCGVMTKYANGNSNYYTRCGSYNQQVGTTIFSYSMQTDSDVYPSYSRVASMKQTSCRSVTVQYVTQSPKRAGAYLELIQGASDAQYGHAAPNTVGTWTARFDGGPFYFQVATDGGYDGYSDESYRVDLAGHASCYTVNGKK